MEQLIETLAGQLEGSVDTSLETKILFSHDASLFELVPEAVIAPKNSQDVQAVVRFVAARKRAYPKLSITARSGGTCMSGGAIGESLVLDFAKHLNRIHSVGKLSAHLQPGVYFRDFDLAAIKHNALLPSYPASRDLCTIGGMVANNSGGEKSLRYGKTEDYIKQLTVVLSDGNEYQIRPLNRRELVAKMAQSDFEGHIYRRLFELLEENYDLIKAAKPAVSKDSTGYHLWNVWDRQTGIFDLTHLFAGSQGTLGLVTDVNLRLVPRPKHSGLLVAFLKDTSRLGELINTVLTHQPTSFEAFDDHTLFLAVKFFPYFRRTLGWKGFFKLALGLLPDGLMLLKGIPKLVLMIEFTGQTAEEVAEKIEALKLTLGPYKMAMEVDETEAKSSKFWTLRRESFNLLRKKVKDKHTAPFIDDLVVPPARLPEFLPRLRKIIRKYKLLATLAGHLGDGNFHIIPLMKIEDRDERSKLRPAMREVNELVLSHGGSLSGEHNDGMIRGPWLEQMYGPKILKIFKQVKQLFDPQNIFNPHKKTDATWEYSLKHIRDRF